MEAFSVSQLFVALCGGEGSGAQGLAVKPLDHEGQGSESQSLYFKAQPAT